MFPAAPPVAEPALNPAKPTSVRVTRTAALAQAVLCLATAAVLLFLALRPSHAIGFDFAPLVYGFGVVYNVGNALLVGIPALVLKPYSPGARVMIVVVEGVTGGLTLLTLPFTAGGSGQAANTAFMLAYTALAAVAFVAGLRPDARQWTTSPYAQRNGNASRL